MTNNAQTVTYIYYLSLSFYVIFLSCLLPLSLSRVNDDGAGDGKNSKIVQKLMPDRDYYLQIQTFDPKGGKFEFSITAW